MQTTQRPVLSLHERIEAALVLLAYFIEQDGDVHLAMYEKFERELISLMTNESARARARDRLAAYRDQRCDHVAVALLTGASS